MKRLLFLSLLLFLSACSNWALKDRCEKTNWFEYSRDVAFSGRYLDEDGFIKDCKGVDRISAVQVDLGFKSGRERYCTYESFFRNGEAGEPVNFKMCDNLVMYNMQERYAQGLANFCKAESGYSYGSAGKVYKNVCIKRDEEKFMPGYLKGRSEYLVRTISQLEKETISFQAVQDQVSQEIARFSGEIHALPSGLRECRTSTEFNSSTQKEEAVQRCEEPYYIRSRRETLYDQADRLRAQFTKNGEILRNMLQDLAYNRNELTKIPQQFQPTPPTMPSH
nr:Protein of unknown function (DUF2799) [uncultured bacterium]